MTEIYRKLHRQGNVLPFERERVTRATFFPERSCVAFNSINRAKGKLLLSRTWTVRDDEKLVASDGAFRATSVCEGQRKVLQGWLVPPGEPIVRNTLIKNPFPAFCALTGCSKPKSREPSFDFYRHALVIKHRLREHCDYYSIDHLRNSALRSPRKVTSLRARARARLLRFHIG